MDPQASPYVKALRKLVSVLQEHTRSVDYENRRCDAIFEVNRAFPPPSGDDYTPREVEAGDALQIKEIAARARQKLQAALDRLRPMRCPPKLLAALEEAHRVLSGGMEDEGLQEAMQRLEAAEKAAFRGATLVEDLELEDDRELVSEARRAMKVRKTAVTGDLVERLEFSISRVIGRSRYTGQPQVLAYDPKAARFVVMALDSYTQDSPFGLGPEHILMTHGKELQDA